MLDFGSGELPRPREERWERQRRRNRLKALVALAIQLRTVALETKHGSPPSLVERRVVIAYSAEPLLRRRAVAAALAGLTNAF
jgi:hypothetical protein